MRNMVSLKKIDDIVPIENADAIVLAVIGGWNAVVKKDEFSPGDTVLYFEIDSFLPADVEQFAFLASKSSKKVIHPDTFQEVTGHVLRTVKLRGQVSQGLVLAPFAGLTPDSTQEQVDEAMSALGVFKYEPPIPAGTGGQIIGKFPNYVQKTDSERVQNLSNAFLASLDSSEWQATEKIDGTSATFLKENGTLRMASRNWEMSPEGEHAYASVAEKFNLSDLMPEGAVLQGEIYGPGLQGNPLKVPQVRLAVFNVDNVDLDAHPEFALFVKENSVPVIEGMTLPTTIEEAVQQVNGMTSHVNPNVQAEGVVWWHKDGRKFAELDDRANFKAINNKFLLKQKD